MIDFRNRRFGEKVKAKMKSERTLKRFEITKEKVVAFQELESYIGRHKHLPDIPSQKEVAAGGIDLGEMNRKLLQKVEELTLYIIDMKKESQQQAASILELKKKK